MNTNYPVIINPSCLEWQSFKVISVLYIEKVGKSMPE